MLARVYLPLRGKVNQPASRIDRVRGCGYAPRMRFDPAIAAQRSFAQAKFRGELGKDLDEVVEAEAIFSTETGDTARAAYMTLQKIGERHPHARAFQAFLIYITWQQVTDETVPTHFKKGLELCDRYLNGLPASLPADEQVQIRQIRELRMSFRNGLGLVEEDEQEEYDRDAFHGGD